MPGVIEQLDAQIAALFAEWNAVTSALALLIAAWVIYPVIYPNEPDTHPLLLTRQSQPNPVRNRHESAVYRSPETPHSYPLRTGLNVKEADAPRWANGKDGDIRDIWREVQRGGKSGPDGKPLPKGLIMTVLGKEEVVEHKIDQLSQEIAIIGSHIQAAGASRVAIYLPNSVEYLLAIFACAFYGLTPVLLPYNQPHPKIYEMLNKVEADALICAAGNLPLDDVAATCPRLRLLTWVVESTSRHMDWNGTPDAFKDRLTVSVWHNVVEDSQATPNITLPDESSTHKPGDLVSVWQSTQVDTKPEYTTFTQGNTVAAVAALISALPARARYSSDDLVLPANTLTHPYVLCQTFAALFCHASLAITSVAEPGVDFALACRGVSPTVVIASAETLAALHAKESANASGVLRALANYSHTRSMAAGRMPTNNFLFSLLAPVSSATGNSPGTLRLILTSERSGAASPPLTSEMLCDLRIFTRARICYALTAAPVAGAIAQTHIFDYRSDASSGPSHFGVPMSSVEIKLVSEDDATVAGSSPEGQLVVSGPAVSGGEARLPVRAAVRLDGTLAYA